MMQIKYLDVPEWLKDSEFYKSLADDEPDSHIEIPPDCLTTKLDSVHTIEDVATIFKAMKFWGVKRIPYAILEYCYTNDFSVWKEELVRNEIAELNVLTTALKDPKLLPLEVAISTNRGEFVDFWLSKNDAEGVHSKNAITQACRSGRSDFVQTLRERGFVWDSFAFCAAAQYGHLDILKYLHENGCPCEGKSFVYAARGGQLECMKYLHTIGCRWDKNLTMEYAVPAHYDTMIRGAQLFGSDQPWTDDFSSSPPVDACVNCLRFALENGCQIRDHACSRVSRYGLLECLQLLHEHGAVWSSLSTAAAAEFGHLSCLQYLHEHGCHWDAKCLLYAVQGGHLHCLQYLHQNGCPWDVKATQLAAEQGHMDCLIYLHEHDCPWDKGVSKAAAENGHLHCLHYLCDHGCPWDESIPQSIFLFTQEGTTVVNGEETSASGSRCEALSRHLKEERGMFLPKNRRMKGQT